jgi:hypothetical protein
MESKPSGIIAAVVAASTAFGGWVITGAETAVVAARSVAVVAAPYVATGTETAVVAAPVVALKAATSPKAYREAFKAATKAKVRKDRALPDGNFVDDYTGSILHKSEVTLDHIVPMREARDALGAGSDAFVAFANDPLNLAITSLSNNARKGGKGLRDSTAMFPDAQVDIMAIGRQVREKYGLAPVE